MIKSNCYTGIITVFIFCIMLLSACAPRSGYSTEMQVKIREMEDKLKKYLDNEKIVKENLKTFDTFDFVVFSNQEWVRLHESHSKDVIVNWPTGHHTNGIERHISDLKEMFVYSPDTKIKVHPVKFGSGEFTCVTGVMTGAFTKPLPVGNGKFIEPTGKKFSISMCTIGHWKNGVMIEEWLYWDSASYMQQIGLAK
ncbi:MAG: polyketide cyclase [Candidatus Firestonebacteria bacterium RIFOXYC2_FULL_39_67]|nr:MAG: polyketide cyclase [Candidatus Firestonebacteria bacterium RIFOXYD2_FULL_39_29]OGF55711.1 MAG: polyketide cyclase [Candidatus Firestonebacteria bacterium RIFOXYC2_FULL_39_67]OGF57972.1 MAG: polyketide cyclase [Candidatus Firestonebacteria bacterium RifOxyC12_full_39_7]